MASIFSKIIAGEIPSYKIAETPDFLAFLDISPLTKGHTLVVPKLEIDYIFDLEDDLLAEMQIFSKKVSVAIKQAFPCERICVIVAGFEVPHAHIHLIPSNEMSDLNFSNKLKLSQEELSTIAEKIKSFWIA